MNTIKQAIENANIEVETKTETQPSLPVGVTVAPYFKEGSTVSKSFCLQLGKLRIFLVPEVLDTILDNAEAIKHVVDQTRAQVLTQGERRFERKAAQLSEKIEKQSADLAARKRAVELMREHKGMDWDSALALAKDERKTA